jgi:hypothetical protein
MPTLIKLDGGELRLITAAAIIIALEIDFEKRKDGKIL